MDKKLANAIGLVYIALVGYVVTQPWHDDIGEYIEENKNRVTETYERGRFWIEANIDLYLMKGM